MELLKVNLLRYKTVVIAEVIEQDESLRTDIWGPLNLIELADTRYAIRSSSGIQISPTGVLYIRGSNDSVDNVITTGIFSTETKAKEYVRIITKLIERVNNGERGVVYEL